MPRILFIAAHRPDRSPSQRFRFEQYLPFLKENGFDYEISYLISEADDKRFYSPGSYFLKFRVFVQSIIKRLSDIRRADQFDIVFVQREAFMTGTTVFEKRLSKASAKMVFDFDDSIWLSNVSNANRNLNWLKDPGKTSRIIAMSDFVIAGNDYLAGYARQFNAKTEVIPTTIDTSEYVRALNHEEKATICIGWSGSITTIQHFNYAVPILKALKEKYGDRLTFKVLGDANYRNKALGIEGIAWSRASEVPELSTFDIGIMPLPDDEWTKGKCGLKGLSYMSLGIPTVMSPVGVNKVIIENGVNGFLATDLEDWVNKISSLIESKELRQKIGNAGRKTVQERYSVEANKELYLKYLKEVLA